MNWRRLMPVAALAALLAFLLYSLPAGAANDRYHVRIGADSVTEAAAVGLDPVVAIDYGSYQYLELSAADYAALRDSGVDFQLVPDGGQLQINGYTFDPVVDGEPRIASNMQAKADEPGFRMVQLVGPTNGDWLAELEAAGLVVLQYYPNHSYLVWDNGSAIEAAESLDFVRWTGLFHPAYKADPGLAQRSGIIRNVDVMFYNDGNIEATLNELTRLGANVLNVYPSQPDKAFFNAIIQFSAGSLDAAARLDTVLWMGFSSESPTLDDEMSSQIIAGNHPGGEPELGYNDYLADLGYDGTGVTWAVIDTGVDYDHPDLINNIVGGFSFPGIPGSCDTGAFPGNDCVGGGHGTHVAGIIGGDATAGLTDPDGFLYGLGVAPGYGIFAMNSLSGSAWPPAGGWQEHSKQAVLGGAIGGNNSWTTGEGTQHGYQASERTHDIMVRDGNFDTTNVAEPFIEVFSAGNSGASGLTAPKEGKNLIVTASTRNFRAGSIDDVSGFSSRGPAVDGRWVPTISAPGETIASSRNDDGGSCSTAIGGTSGLYSFCSGTSMAAPHAAGVIVLTTEWWRTFNSGADPSPAMAKALLVNHAVDMGTADIPNINEGWGRVNATNIISSSVSMVYRDQIDTFTDTGQQYVMQVGIADPSQPFKVTVAWSDAPGAVGANPALVNDLNLTVDVNGSTYLGNVFTSGWSATGGSADAINNLENVFVENASGSATITIDALLIAGDGVPYNGDTTDQDFVIVCQNCALFPDFGLTVDPAVNAVCAPSDAQFIVEVASILGYNDSVTLSVNGEPAGATTAFSANPVIPAQPPVTSTLTIGNLGAIAAGSYDLDVVGVATTSTHTTTVTIDLFDMTPMSPTLTSPSDGAINQPAQTVFTWQDVAQGDEYTIEIATDAGFGNIVESATVNGTTYTSAGLLTNVTYYWRVSAANICGDGGTSAVREFTVEPAPGDCTAGAIPLVTYSEDFEGSADGWTHNGGTANSWALVTTDAHSGAQSFHAGNPASLSDQYLVSPPISIPGSAFSPVTLQFWNRQGIEDNAGTGCYDGGIIEVSTDGGSSWTQIPDSAMLTDSYDGPVSTGFSNPIGGQDAWCGDPQDWLNSIVDMSAYAGMEVQLRFRMTSDVTVGRDGWWVDDVKVQACPAPYDMYMPSTQHDD